MKPMTKQSDFDQAKTINDDGSPSKVWSPTYQDYYNVNNWYDFFYYKKFNGENYDECDAYANNQMDKQ